MTAMEHLPFLNPFIIIALILPPTTLAASIASDPICPVNDVHCGCIFSGPFYSLQCSNISDSNDFAEIIGNLSATAAILELGSLSMEFLSLETLHNSSLHTLIIKNSAFTALNNSSKEFLNESRVENLHQFSLENVTTSEEWTWKQLAPLDKLQVLFAYNSSIGSKIPKDFGQHVSKSLVSLTISESNVTEIEDGSFQELNNLTNLRITHSKLRTVSRDIFPSDTKLRQLRLDFNRIHELPSGLFENMTDLKVVSLSNNTISSLPEDVFKPLWRPDLHLELRGNPIKCDCRLKWITTSESKPADIIGQCSHPKRLFGYDIKDLTNNDLNC